MSDDASGPATLPYTVISRVRTVPGEASWVGMLDFILAAWADEVASDTEETAVDSIFEEDGDYDMLTGSSGADWFIIGSGDVITDLVKL